MNKKFLFFSVIFFSLLFSAAAQASTSPRGCETDTLKGGIFCSSAAAKSWCDGNTLICTVESVTACPANTASSTYAFSCNVNSCVRSCNSGYSDCSGTCKTNISVPSNCTTFNQCTAACTVCSAGYSWDGTNCSTAVLRLGNDSVGAGGSLIQSVTPSLFIVGSGNVGIGVTSPGSLLDVQMSKTLSSFDSNGYTAGKAFLTLTNTGTAVGASSALFGGLRVEGGGTYSSGIVSSLSGSSVITGSNVSSVAGLNLSADNQGVGTVGSLYGVKTDFRQTSSGTINNIYGLYVSNSATAGTITNKYGIYVEPSDFYNYFAGNVGIGTTSPGTKLAVTTTGNYSISAGGKAIGDLSPLLYSPTDAASKGYVDTAISDTSFWAVNASSSIYNTNLGSVGIGTTKPVGALDIFDTVKFSPEGTIYDADSSHYLDLSNTRAEALRIQGNIYSTQGVLKTLGTGNSFLMGNVGIGTTNPLSRLDVTSNDVYPAIFRTVSMTNGIQIVLSDESPRAGYDASLGSLAFDSSGIVSIKYDVDQSAWGTIIMNKNYTLITPGQLTKFDSFSSIADSIITDTGTNIGISTTSPAAKLEVAGLSGYSILAGNQKIGNVAIPMLDSDVVTLGYLKSNTSSSAYLRLNGGTMGGDINMANNNIGNIASTTIATAHINKLYVNTIDPLYKINGLNYATFASAISGGVKEEYVGKAKLVLKNKKEAEVIIDFDKVAEGSDLWVWRKVVDFNKDNIDLAITPYGNFAQVYYLIEGNKLILRANKPTEVSYRLIGRRFDWRDWPTKALDQSISGLEVK